VGFSWSDCGPATDPVQIKSLSVAPDPLKIPGKNQITVNIHFYLYRRFLQEISLLAPRLLLQNHLQPIL